MWALQVVSGSPSGYVKTRNKEKQVTSAYLRNPVSPARNRRLQNRWETFASSWGWAVGGDGGLPGTQPELCPGQWAST